ncbi:MAG: endonuclease/exonuclease/phosphatase family protein [Armatimonadota bacterium]
MKYENYDKLSVLTYNIHQGRYGEKELAKYIASLDADIICLQESNSTQHWAAPIPMLSMVTPDYENARYGELDIFSKYPMLTKRALHLSNITGTQCLVVQVDFNGKLLTIINVHFSSPNRRPEGVNFNKDNPTMNARAEELMTLTRLINSYPDPIIVAGDFNTPPRGHIYNALNYDLNDSHKLAGWGTGYTFPSIVPLLRIDYIFARSGVSFINSKVLSSKNSDHRPVFAILGIDSNIKTPSLPNRDEHLIFTE